MRAKITFFTEFRMPLKDGLREAVQVELQGYQLKRGLVASHTIITDGDGNFKYSHKDGWVIYHAATGRIVISNETNNYNPLKSPFDAMRLLHAKRTGTYTHIDSALSGLKNNNGDDAVKHITNKLKPYPKPKEAKSDQPEGCKVDAGKYSSFLVFIRSIDTAIESAFENSDKFIELKWGNSCYKVGHRRENLQKFRANVIKNRTAFADSALPVKKVEQCGPFVKAGEWVLPANSPSYATKVYIKSAQELEIEADKRKDMLARIDAALSTPPVIITAELPKVEPVAPEVKDLPTMQDAIESSRKIGISIPNDRVILEVAPKKPVSKYADFIKHAGYTPIQAGRVESTLDKLIRSDGVIMRKHEYIKMQFNKGMTAQTKEVNRIKEMSRLKYFRATTSEQNEHEKRIKDGGKITEYWLYDGDKYGYRYPVNATEYAYFKYLEAIAPKVKLVEAVTDDYTKFEARLHSDIAKNEQADNEFKAIASPEISTAQSSNIKPITLRPRPLYGINKGIFSHRIPRLWHVCQADGVRSNKTLHGSHISAGFKLGISPHGFMIIR